jgi:hypothetical protein
MRTLLGGTVLALLLHSPLRAEALPYEATIVLPEVAVRSGPSPKFYVTGKLTRNDRVRVRDERGEWLVIEPPKGSFSWINGRLIERNGHTATVLADDAPTRVGSNLVNNLPDVEGSKLKRGTLVLIKPGPPAEDSSGIWYAIEPPAQEVRYLPKNAVHVAPAVERLSSGAVGDDPLWQQAEQAERQGNILDAQRLYNQFAQQTNDHELRMRAYNRIEFLRQGQRISTPPNYQPGRSEAQASPQFPTYQPLRPVPAQTAAYPPPGMAAQPAQSNPGRLRTAAFFIDGKQAYVLEDSQGRPVLYATAAGGLNLDGYLNRVVTLSGQINYRGELRTYYIVAQQVNVLP